MLARRRLRSSVSEFIVLEWRGTLVHMEAEGVKSRRAPHPTLEGMIALSHWVTPAPVGRQRSRDPKGEPCLATALAAGAKFVVNRDPDLLVLAKPFGIEIVTPRALLNRITHFA